MKQFTEFSKEDQNLIREAMRINNDTVLNALDGKIVDNRGIIMKIILPSNTEITLTPEQSRDLLDEMRYACHSVSVFPVMEMLLSGMEA